MVEAPLKRLTLHQTVYSAASPSKPQSRFCPNSPNNKNATFHQREYARHAIAPRGGKKIQLNGVDFCSFSEAACASILEKFIAGFRVICGETYQVPIDGTHHVDFMLHGVLIEYHHVRLYSERGRYGDFAQRENYRSFRREVTRMRSNHYRRNRYINNVRGELAGEYYKKRRKILNQEPRFRQTELIVVTSVEELHERVLLRFSEDSCPDQASFLEIFNQELRRVIQLNRERQRENQLCSDAA